jgi:hypothetical protein
MRVLLFVGLLVACGALRTSKKNKYADASVVSSEVGRRCTATDFPGAVEVLESHGRPVGWELGKQLMKACFIDKEGQCLLGKARCAWMQKCFSAEGPCERPPVKEAFLETEGGQVAYDSMGLEGAPAKKAAPVKDNIGAAGWSAINAATKMLAKQIPKQLKYNLMLAKGARDMFNSYIPTQKGKIWFYKLASLGLWFLLACATEYNNVKMQGVGDKAKPVYAWYAPMGVYKDPAYTYPVYESKLLQKTEDWTC